MLGAIAGDVIGSARELLATRTLAALDDRLRSVVLPFCERFGIRTG